MRRIAILCAVGTCIAVLLGAGSAMAQPVILTNAVVNLGASPPTVTLQDLFDAFGSPGQVWQVVDGTPVALVVVSWSAGQIEAELASTAPGDYLVGVLPLGVPAPQRTLFTVTVPGDNPHPPCFDNTTRFVNCGNGTVTDTVTGLIWLFDANCVGLLDYTEASDAASVLADGQCGLTDGSRPGDWRLPTKEEWEVMVDPSCSATPPAMVGNGPGGGCYTANPWSLGVQSAYWTSTTDSGDTDNAWCAYVVRGEMTNFYYKRDILFVWPVRGAQ